MITVITDIISSQYAPTKKRKFYPTISNVVGWMKYTITKQINLLNGTQGYNIFQRSFHDHIIRDEADYLKIWNYIDTNPQKWREDCFYIAES
jgi:hypothetical protein